MAAWSAGTVLMASDAQCNVIFHTVLMPTLQSKAVLC